MMADVRRRVPDADIRGVTIEPMVTAGDARSFLVGVKNDPVFGPVVSFGAGGTMTELLHDNAVALPPLNRMLAERLIDKTRISRLLGPFRNMPPVDKTRRRGRPAAGSPTWSANSRISRRLDINPLLRRRRRRDRRRRPHQGAPAAHDTGALRPYGDPPLSGPSHPAQLPARRRRTDHPADPARGRRDRAGLRPQPLGRGEVLPLHADAPRTDAGNARPLHPDRLQPRNGADRHRSARTGKEKEIGVARYTINPDGKSCEFAIVVSDERQKQGIGSALMKGLMDAARGQGLRSIEGEILADNHRMLELMAFAGLFLAARPERPGHSPGRMLALSGAN